MNFSRRSFVKGGVTAFTFGFAAPQMLCDIAFAQGVPSRNLVVVYLSGGNDSLSTVIPYRDPFYIPIPETPGTVATGHADGARAIVSADASTLVPWRLPATEVLLTAQGGMPGDRWASQSKYGPEFQLATARADYARLIANGQPLELHGDNLYLQLDLSSENLPIHSLLRAGDALLQVTPVAHNGCKKWVQRFGLCPMQLNLDPAYRHLHLRGIYLRVVSDGRVRVGDRIQVVQRG